MNIRRGIILAAMDALLLAALFFAVWYAQLDKGEIAWRFSQVFLPLTGVIIAGTVVAMRRWAPRRPLAPGEIPARAIRPFSLFGALENPPRERG